MTEGTEFLPPFMKTRKGNVKQIHLQIEVERGAEVKIEVNLKDCEVEAQTQAEIHPETGIGIKAKKTI